MRLFLPLFASLGALLLSACSPTTLDAAGATSPVLLGPIDRVGGHRAGAGQERTVQRIEGEVMDFASATTETKGNVQTTTSTSIRTDSSVLDIQISNATDGRPERDVRIDQVEAGAYALVGSGSAFAKQWVGMKARVVEVRREH
jgi:hypothetical protein